MILDRLLGRGRPRQLDPPRRSGGWGTQVPEIPGWLGPVNQSSAGVQVTEEKALSLSAVFSAVNLLSSVIAALPLHCYRKKSRGKELADSLPAYNLLHSAANPEMTAFTFRKTLEFHRLLWGNGYAEIGWDGGGNVRSLWPVEPWRVRPERYEEDGSLYYLIDRKRKVAPADMVHVPLISYDGVCGKAFIDYAMESLGLGIASQEFAARFFGNGARPGGLLKNPQANIKKEARDELRESWDRAHQGPAHSHKVGVLWGGWEFDRNAGAIAPEEAQLLETRRFTTEEVARWFNIPPHLLRDLSRATFSNIEHQGIDFVIYSLGPGLVQHEQEYDRKLLDPPKTYCKHDVRALLRGDSAARSAFYRELWNIGVWSVNEIREMEDENPIGVEGDARFVPLNMTTLEEAAEGPPEEPEPGEPQPAPVPGQTPPPGQGGTQPPAEPKPAPAPPKVKGGAAMGAHRDLLAHTLARLARKETNAARRVAKEPKHLDAFVEDFYPKHAALLAEALLPVVSAVRELVGLDDWPGRVNAKTQAGHLAGDWCDRSRDRLVELSGQYTPAEFAGAAEGLFAELETCWPSDVATGFIREMTNAEDAAT